MASGRRQRRALGRVNDWFRHSLKHVQCPVHTLVHQVAEIHEDYVRPAGPPLRWETG